MRRIGGLLGRSPFGPLYEQMVKVTGSVEELPRLVRALARGDEEGVARSAGRIRRIEREADDVKSDIRDRLSNSMFTSVERAETLHLVSCIDSIADDALKVAKLVAVRKTPVPEALSQDLAALAERAREAAQGLVDVLGMLRDLMEGDASRAEGAKVLERIASLQRLDSAVEDAEVEVLRALFAKEKDLGSVDVMILMHVVGQVADTARQAENVADAIRRIVLNR